MTGSPPLALQRYRFRFQVLFRLRLVLSLSLGTALNLEMQSLLFKCDHSEVSADNPESLPSSSKIGLEPQSPPQQAIHCSNVSQLLLFFGLFRPSPSPPPTPPSVFSQEGGEDLRSVWVQMGVSSACGSLLPRVFPQGTLTPLASHFCLPPCQDAIFQNI